MLSMTMNEFLDATMIEVNGASLAVVDKGGGDPVVFVHGGVSDLRSWSNQMPAFSKSHRAISYSRRYHKPNSPISSDQPDPIQNHVDDLAELLGLLQATPAHIVGHSWGGLVALMLAMQKPPLCRSLALIEAPTVSVHIQIPPKPAHLLRLLLSKPKLGYAIAKLGAGALAPAEKAFRKGDDKVAIEYFGRGVLGGRAFEELSTDRYQQVWDNHGPDRALALYRGFPDLRNAPFKNVAMPVLLLSGGASPYVFRQLNEALEMLLPAAVNQVIPRASHMVHEDEPGEVNAAIMRFLGV